MPSERALRNNLRLFYAVRFLRYAQLWLPVWVIYLNVEQGFSLTEITTADALFFVGITLLEIPTGAVADRWGRGRSVGLGALALAAALALFAFTTDYAVLLLSFGFWAIAETLTSGADLALLYDTLRALGREHEYERHAGRGEAALWVGVAIGTLLGGPVATITSTQATILLGAGTTTLTAILAFAMTEPPRMSAGQLQRNYLANMLEAFRVVSRRPAVRAVFAVTGVLGAGLGAQMYLVQPFLRDQGVEIGFWFSALQLPIQLGGIVGALFAATLAYRLGEARVFPLIALVGAAALGAVWLLGSLVALALMPLAMVFESALRPVASGYVNRRVPSDQRATVLSMQSFAWALFIAPLAPIVGAIADARGPAAPFGLLAGVVAVGGALTISIWLRAHRAEQAEQPSPQRRVVRPATD